MNLIAFGYVTLSCVSYLFLHKLPQSGAYKSKCLFSNHFHESGIQEQLSWKVLAHGLHGFAVKPLTIAVIISWLDWGRNCFQCLANPDKPEFLVCALLHKLLGQSLNREQASPRANNSRARFGEQAEKLRGFKIGCCSLFRI